MLPGIGTQTKPAGIGLDFNSGCTEGNYDIQIHKKLELGKTLTAI
ncbi:hypothetical protein [Turicimonas muris]|nr:hypothetical protein [Turicimonas muris]